MFGHVVKPRIKGFHPRRNIDFFLGPEQGLKTNHVEGVFGFGSLLISFLCSQMETFNDEAHDAMVLTMYMVTDFLKYLGTVPVSITRMKRNPITLASRFSNTKQQRSLGLLALSLRRRPHGGPAGSLQRRCTSHPV